MTTVLQVHSVNSIHTVSLTSLDKKLMNVLSKSESNGIIAWKPCGRAFVILNPRQFTAEILPKYFKTAKFASFIRKLHRWGFSTLDCSQSGTFSHEQFIKGRIDLACMIKCHNPKRHGLEEDSLPSEKETMESDAEFLLAKKMSSSVPAQTPSTSISTSVNDDTKNRRSQRAELKSAPQHAFIPQERNCTLLQSTIRQPTVAMSPVRAVTEQPGLPQPSSLLGNDSRTSDLVFQQRAQIEFEIAQIEHAQKVRALTFLLSQRKNEEAELRARLQQQHLEHHHALLLDQLSRRRNEATKFRDYEPSPDRIREALRGSSMMTHCSFSPATIVDGGISRRNIEDHQRQPQLRMNQITQGGSTASKLFSSFHPKG